MGFFWELKLTSNEIKLLKACRDYTDAVKASKKNTNPGALVTQFISPILGTLRASCVVARSLHGEGLLSDAPSTNEYKHWHVTERGRVVLSLIESDPVFCKRGKE